MIVAPASSGIFSPLNLGAAVVCILMGAASVACTGGGEDSVEDERVREVEPAGGLRLAR